MMAAGVSVDLRQNLEKVCERLVKARQSVGRRADEVTLVIVTKRRSPDLISALAALGVCDVGENYVQELVEKQDSLGDIVNRVNWHLIGPVQRRKIKQLPGRITMAHAVDRIEVAQKLEETYRLANFQLPVLLQLNISGEATKSGWAFSDGAFPDEFLTDVRCMMEMKYVRLSGLMTMPPMSGRAEDSRPYYVKLRKMQDKLNRQFGTEIFRELSIGTSFDFEVAVQEGATYVRIGEAIVGARESANV
jgi:pyridoxal phosphate enzyme (YggS family)